MRDAETNTVAVKSFAFAVRCVKLRKYLTNEKNEYEMSKQLLRCGTSIGANNAEACNAISKADFKSKSFIALKEARESLYWIDLLHRNQYLSDDQYQSIYNDCEELVKIFVSRCKTLNNGEDLKVTKDA